MDVHVPLAITTELRLRGADVLTAQEDGASQLEDSQLLDRATALDRVLVTQDTGFLRVAARRQKSGERFAGIIYAPQLDVTIGQCVRDIELIIRTTISEDWANWVEYLPLK
jgi:hypothetical protein